MNATLNQQQVQVGAIARLILTVITLIAAIALIGGTAATITTSTVNPGGTFEAVAPALSGEVAGGAPCRTQGPTVACASLFEQRLAPGELHTRVITIKSSGTVPVGTLQLWTAGCQQGAPAAPFSGTGNLCAVAWIAIHDDAHNVCQYPVQAPGACPLRAGSTLSDLAARFGASSPLNLPVDQLASGIPFSISLELDPSAGNDYQGRAAIFTLNWRAATP